MDRSQRDLDATGSAAPSPESGSPSPESGSPSRDPDESFVRPPRLKPSPTDHVFGADQMVHFYDAPGEYGWIAEGRDHGLSGLSVIITDTRPGGGPPLHKHDTEEAQVLPSGRYRVLIGEQRFDVDGPATVRIPAGVPHTFVNPGDRPVHIVGVVPGDTISYEELGPNPLLEDPEREGGGSRASRTPMLVGLGLVLSLATLACADAGSPASPTEASARPEAATRALGQIHMQAVSPAGHADLAAARRATAHFHRLENADLAEYVPVTECKVNPPVGGMGYHFGNFELYLDGVADPTTPEILLYEPQKNGRLRLVAVEYAIPYLLWQGEVGVDDPPQLFGRDMKRVDDQEEWQLHVWLWKHNPAGIFEDLNPTVSCEHA